MAIRRKTKKKHGESATKPTTILLQLLGVGVIAHITGALESLSDTSSIQWNQLMELSSLSINSNGTYNSHSSENEQTTNTAVVHRHRHIHNYTYNPVIYGHLHMAKTAGTEINGELAVRYERICGHKGYSYDSHALNQKLEMWKSQHPGALLMEEGGPPDSFTQYQKDYNRGRVPDGIIDEIGFHDCDWISLETRFGAWHKVAKQLHPVPLELHIPCRDPIEHLLSHCNYINRTFDCDVSDDAISMEVRKCFLPYMLMRFNDDRSRNRWLDQYSVSFKCFDAIPIQPYLDYIGSKLQPRRFVRPYVHRDTNLPRDKDTECLLKDESLQEKVKKHLEENYPAFRFCKSCIGSKDDLLSLQST